MKNLELIQLIAYVLMIIVNLILLTIFINIRKEIEEEKEDSAKLEESRKKYDSPFIEITNVNDKGDFTDE